jgi:hypothetical protein
MTGQDQKTRAKAARYPSWMEQYRSKVVRAADALKGVHSGDRVYIHPGAAEPEALVLELIRRGPELRDVEIVHLMTLGNADYVKPELEGHLRHVAFFVGANVREAVNSGRADYLPVLLYEVPRLFETGVMPLDVCLIQVSHRPGQPADAAHARRLLHPRFQVRRRRRGRPATVRAAAESVQSRPRGDRPARGRSDRGRFNVADGYRRYSRLGAALPRRQT